MGAGWLVCGVASGEEGTRALRDRKIPSFVKAAAVAELAVIRLGAAAQGAGGWFTRSFAYDL